MTRPQYPAEQVAAVFADALGRRPKRQPLHVRAQQAVDALAAVLDDDRIDSGDRVALEDARAALERYTEEAAR